MLLLGNDPELVYLPRRLSRRGTAAPRAALTLISATPIATGRAALLTSAHRRRAVPVRDRSLASCSLASCSVATGPIRVSTDLLGPSRPLGLGGSPGGGGRAVSIGAWPGELRNPGKGGWTVFACPPDVAPLATSKSRGRLKFRFLASRGRDPLSRPRSARIRSNSVLAGAKPLAAAVSDSAIGASAQQRKQSPAPDCVVNRPQRLQRRLVIAMGTPGRYHNGRGPTLTSLALVGRG